MAAAAILKSVANFRFWVFSIGHVVMNACFKFGCNRSIFARVIAILLFTTWRRRPSWKLSGYFRFRLHFVWHVVLKLGFKFHRNRLIFAWVIDVFVYYGKSLSTPQKWGFLGSYIPNFQNWLMRPPKGTSLGGTTLFEPSTIKIGSAVWAVALSRNYKKKPKFTWFWGFSAPAPANRSEPMFAEGVRFGLRWHMPILVVIGSPVPELWGVQISDFPSETYMAYNNLPCTTVQAVNTRGLDVK